MTAARPWRIAPGCGYVMIDDFPRYGADLDAAVRAERDGLVKVLLKLADQIERANLDRVGDGLA